MDTTLLYKGMRLSVYPFINRLLMEECKMRSTGCHPLMFVLIAGAIRGFTAIHHR